MSSKRVVLIDGTWLIFRAYFAIPSNFSTASGLPTNAIFGFATMFRKLMSGKTPDLGAVVFDSPGPTVRREMYPEYKAQRPPLKSDLKVQLPWIQKVVEAHRFPLIRKPGFEADDIIATLSDQARALGYDVHIISGDKDLAQLVDDHVRMIDTMRDVTYDPELVRKKWGVPPEQIADLLAIMGDKSDNIPGVPGIGQKGAAKLLETYGSLDGIYQNLEQLKGRQRKNLEENRELARLSRELTLIDRQVPLDVGVEQLVIEPPAPETVNELFKELEFYSLLSRDAAGQEAVLAELDYSTLESPQQLDERLSSIQGPLALYPIFDLQTPSMISAQLVGFGLCGTTRAAVYAPIPAGPDRQRWLTILKRYMEDGAVPKVAHNAKELWHLLANYQIELKGVVGDTMLASYLVEPTKIIPHRLEQLVKEYLHRTIPQAKTLTGGGRSTKRFAEIESEMLAGFAALRAEMVAGLWPLVAAKVDEAGLMQHLVEHDLALSWVLGRMEREGILVDRADLKQLGIDFAAKREEYAQNVFRLAGQEFNIGSTKQLAKVLFEDLGLPVIKRTKTGYSTNVAVLERLASEHQIAREVLLWRSMSKLINTYTDVLQKAVNPESGRIHATFNQSVAASGRLISTDPDLQRTPIKTPEGKRIRQAFIPAPGCRLISADWSQIELRVLAHFSSDPLLLQSFQNGWDIHRITAGQLFDCQPDEVTPEQRNVGKTVNFATIYGQGATALGQLLKIPRKEAKKYIKGYFKAYAGVRVWLDRTIEEAMQSGYVSTLVGRRRYIPELSSNSFMDVQAGQRIAANTPIQGSAADICKMAMLQISKRFEEAGLTTRMLLQVHDELVFEAPAGELEQTLAIIRDRMEHCYPLSVPLVVDIGVGSSWAEAH